MGSDEFVYEGVRVFTPRQRGHIKRARVACIRPASGLRIGTQGPLPLFGPQFLAIHHFRSKHCMGAADRSPPDCAGIRIAGVGIVLMRGCDLQALEIAARHKIGDAGHRIRSVHGGGSLFQDLYTTDSDRRHSVHIYEAATDQTRRDVYLPASVEQHERTGRTQAAEIYAGYALQHGGRRPGTIIPALALTDHAVGHTEVFEKLDKLRSTLFREGSPVNRRNRIGQINGEFLDGCAGHYHFVKFQHRGCDPQGQCRGLPDPHRNLTYKRGVANKRDSYGLLARRYKREVERPFCVRIHARIQASDIHLDCFQRVSVRGVNHRARNTTGRLRMNRCCQQGNEQRQAEN